jgi:hypothetical protein
MLIPTPQSRASVPEESNKLKMESGHCFLVVVLRGAVASGAIRVGCEMTELSAQKPS